jgi:pimeloyl-ACP methyl ester carboxylesterase
MQTFPSRFITINQIKTHYVDEGSGAIPILLVHGFNAHLDYWYKNITMLSQTHRVIALDLIGFGDSDKPKVDYTLELLTSFLKSFLEALNIKQCYLIGHSMGGGVALQFTLDHPELVKKLVLVSSAGFNQQIPLLLRLGTLPFIGPLVIKHSKKRIAHGIKYFTYSKNTINTDFINNNYRINKLPGAMRTTCNLLQTNANFQGIRTEILKALEQRMHEIKVPVLIVWGKQDHLLSVAGAYTAKKLIPQAELHILDQCGHTPQLEKTQEFNELIQKFCQG